MCLREIPSENAHVEAYEGTRMPWPKETRKSPPISTNASSSIYPVEKTLQASLEPIKEMPTTDYLGMFSHRKSIYTYKQDGEESHDMTDQLRQKNEWPTGMVPRRDRKAASRAAFRVSSPRFQDQ